MTMSLLWYVLAGVLLGFAASTLWEWLYFRRKRTRIENDRIEELEIQLADEQSLNEQMRLVHTSAPAESLPEYASPGVFLDSEAPEPSANVVAASPPPAVADAGSDEPPPPPPQQPGPSAGSAPAEPVATVAQASETSPATRPEPVAPPDTRAEPVAPPDTYAFVEAEFEDSEPVAGERSEEFADAFENETIGVDGYEDESTILERLAAELERPPEERQPAAPAVRPKSTVSRSKDHPDNLSKIKGIGDVYKFRLFAAGIFTWHQVAESDIETLRAATHAYPGSNVHEWPPQARALAEQFGRENAFYTGPVPDDLTQIIGIGPVSERTLYRAGICTYAQLAGATVDELQELFPIAIAGDEPDFKQWIRLAIDYANRKAQ